MRYGDGLSNKERLLQATRVSPLTVTDSDIASLLRRIETLAAKVPYYGFDNRPDGCFDRLLGDLKRIQAAYESGTEHVPDGDMDPAQALLYVFARQLSRIAGDFNRRWAGLPDWYLDRLLQVAPLAVSPERIWVAFRKEGAGLLRLKKGEVFTSPAKNRDVWRYRLVKDFQVYNTTVSQVLTACYASGQKIASGRLEVAQLSLSDSDAAPLPASAGDTGFILTSPMLLLREGQRTVVLDMETEFSPNDGKSGPDFSENGFSQKILGRLFDLRISTAQGWSKVEDYTLKRRGDRNEVLELSFALDDQFPATIGCTAEIHDIGSAFPALKIILNTDEGYASVQWLKSLRMKRFRLHVSVSEATLLSVYNEIGQVDPSRPFAPFVIGAERGAWFVVGNYEMAVKPTLSVGLHIRWSGLPEDTDGLYGYYRDYGDQTVNDSFRIGADYLAEYKWQADPEQESLPLFASEPPGPDKQPLAQGPLSSESILNGIRVGRMAPVTEDEAAYDYDMRARSGFIRLTLTDPQMGFGEKRYQYLYTESLIRNLFKKQAPPYLNPPLQPNIERLTMDYHAEQEIDFRSGNLPAGTAFLHLYPLGCASYRLAGGAAPLFHFSESAANLLIGLRNVRSGDTVRLYFDLKPLREDCGSTGMPEVEWYAGDGYRWQRLPDGAVTEDTTRNLLTGGCVEFAFPGTIPAEYYDPEGILWLRAGINANREYLSRIHGIYANPAELIRIPGENGVSPDFRYRDPEMELIPEKEVPGLREVLRIALSAPERPAENGIRRRIRVADYVSHRGRAVTPRDFERLVLQEFPGIIKVKCIPGAGIVKVVIVPRYTPPGPAGWSPVASTAQVLRVREYLETCCPASAAIEVLNPRYEEIVVRCRVSFRPSLSPANCRSRLKALCDRLIAPWRKKWEPPYFGYYLIPNDFRLALAAEDYVTDVTEFSLVRISLTRGGQYDMQEFDGSAEVKPSVPWGIFVPASEHLFNHAEVPFGVDEMTVGDTFIVVEPDQTFQ